MSTKLTEPCIAAAFTTVGQCVKQSFSINGIRAPFQGLFTTIVRNVPANCVYLGSFEEIKRRAALSRNCKPSELPAPIVLGAAGTGGLIYWATVYPIDVCKSAIMTVSLSMVITMDVPINHVFCKRNNF